MGTRGLTIVTYNNETRVAQYGQWDHYPSGQGVIALNFLRDPKNVEALRNNIDKCYWIDPAAHEAIVDEFTGQSSTGKGWMTMEESDLYCAAYPSLHRDTCAKILQVIAEATGPVPLQDQSDFANDTLMCEGIYSVDLDRNVFTSEYAPYPTKSYDLDNLPTPEEYLEAFKEPSELEQVN